LGHAVVGALAAQLKEQDALAGAIGGAGAAIANPLLDQAIGGADASGWGSDPTSAQKLQSATLQLSSMAISAGVASALGKDGMTAALTAQNETVNNYLSQKRPNLLTLSEQERYNEAFKRGDTNTLNELTQRSAARDQALANACGSTAPSVCRAEVMAALDSGNKVLTVSNGLTIAVPANTPELLATPRPANEFQNSVAQSVADGLIGEGIASGAGALLKGAGFVAGRLFGYSETSIGEGAVIAKGAADTGTADATALQRAYLNNKFGRTGDLNLDINIRGNQETATNFFRSQGVSEGNIPSYLTGIDFTQPVSVQALGSGKPLWQYQTPGAPQGNWYSFSPFVQPTELGISPLGFNRATQAVESKTLSPYLTKEPVNMLRSTSASVNDFWSVSGQSYPTIGGERQLFSTQKPAFVLTPQQ
ncbi:polymorphic toxin type 46 domain-containing protein, partial [Propionivibrio sp.]|uniref:polymorphic toxin type 46 domain-containing protein n=1 Tax=Propionivibrio sp. TaxID=2212460 RepID=UPI0026041480